MFKVSPEDQQISTTQDGESVSWTTISHALPRSCTVSVPKQNQKVIFKIAEKKNPV